MANELIDKFLSYCKNLKEGEEPKKLSEILGSEKDAHLFAKQLTNGEYPNLTEVQDGKKSPELEVLATSLGKELESGQTGRSYLGLFTDKAFMHRATTLNTMHGHLQELDHLTAMQNIDRQIAERRFSGDISRNSSDYKIKTAIDDEIANLGDRYSKYNPAKYYHAFSLRRKKGKLDKITEYNMERLKKQQALKGELKINLGLEEAIATHGFFSKEGLKARGQLLFRKVRLKSTGRLQDQFVKNMRLNDIADGSTSVNLEERIKALTANRDSLSTSKDQKEYYQQMIDSLTAFQSKITERGKTLSDGLTDEKHKIDSKYGQRTEGLKDKIDGNRQYIGNRNLELRMESDFGRAYKQICKDLPKSVVTQLDSRFNVHTQKQITQDQEFIKLCEEQLGKEEADKLIEKLDSYFPPEKPTENKSEEKVEDKNNETNSETETREQNQNPNEITPKEPVEEKTDEKTEDKSEEKTDEKTEDKSEEKTHDNQQPKTNNPSVNDDNENDQKAPIQELEGFDRLKFYNDFSEKIKDRYDLPEGVDKDNIGDQKHFEFQSKTNGSKLELDTSNSGKVRFTAKDKDGNNVSPELKDFEAIVKSYKEQGYDKINLSANSSDEYNQKLMAALKLAGMEYDIIGKDGKPIDRESAEFKKIDEGSEKLITPPEINPKVITLGENVEENTGGGNSKTENEGSDTPRNNDNTKQTGNEDQQNPPQQTEEDVLKRVGEILNRDDLNETPNQQYKQEMSLLEKAKTMSKEDFAKLQESDEYQQCFKNESASRRSDLSDINTIMNNRELSDEQKQEQIKPYVEGYSIETARISIRNVIINDNLSVEDKQKILAPYRGINKELDQEFDKEIKESSSKQSKTEEQNKGKGTPENKGDGDGKPENKGNKGTEDSHVDMEKEENAMLHNIANLDRTQFQKLQQTKAYHSLPKGQKKLLEEINKTQNNSALTEDSRAKKLGRLVGQYQEETKKRYATEAPKKHREKTAELSNVAMAIRNNKQSTK